MPKIDAKKIREKNIENAVKHFEAHRNLFESFAQSLMTYFQNDKTLSQHIHFIKYRIKKPDHLREKLERKSLDVSEKDLFDKITDLAGIRIIHLHTDQIREIHQALLGIFDEQKLQLVEEPVANCWDVEYENLFREFGLSTCSRESLYTTIHYVVQANQRTKVTCEIQVRTLMDEVWGEVSHLVNYPLESPSTSCQNQLKVLARLTTGCTRLVDSIFQSHSEKNADLAFRECSERLNRENALPQHSQPFRQRLAEDQGCSTVSRAPALRTIPTKCTGGTGGRSPRG